jgi:hypothetical protein
MQGFGTNLEKHKKAARKWLKMEAPQDKQAKPEALYHFMQMKKKEKALKGLPTEASSSSCGPSSSVMKASTRAVAAVQASSLKEASSPKKKEKKKGSLRGSRS